MSEPLVPCPKCQRHVRSTETGCPFCDAPNLAPMPAPQPPPVVREQAPVYGGPPPDVMLHPPAVYGGPPASLRLDDPTGARSMVRVVVALGALAGVAGLVYWLVSR